MDQTARHRRTKGPKRYLAMFRKAGSTPCWWLEDGWFSISIEASSVKMAERWARQRAKDLAPWLEKPLRLVQVERHCPRPELAGPYRGLIVRMD